MSITIEPIDYVTLTSYLSEKSSKYDTSIMPFYTDEDFIKAIQDAPTALEQNNVIDNFVLYLAENFKNTTRTIDYLNAHRPDPDLTAGIFKKIIVNFNGTGCPPYLKSVHEQYLMNNLGATDTAVYNVSGVGINAKKSLVENLVDVSYAKSLPERVQEVLDYIRDYAADDCAIEIFGHSRGGVEAIILARIVSQKYPNVKVVAHDPVPGKLDIPLVQESYYKKNLDVSYFLNDETTKTIESILESPHLKIRGALMVPWRRDDVREHFALIDGEHVYEADYFFPLELPGFHSLGLYEYTNVDYSVYWENIPLLGSNIRQINRTANQGEKHIDSERDTLKSLAHQQYNQLVELFTNTTVNEMEADDAASLNEQLTQKRKALFEQLKPEYLIHSEIHRNPVYHARQSKVTRKVPDALDVFDDVVYEDFYEYFKENRNEDGNFVPYTGVELDGLIRKLVYTPSDIKESELLYLTIHWMVATALGNQSELAPALIENLRYNLSSNKDFAQKVKNISTHCGFTSLFATLNKWKKNPQLDEIAAEITQSIDKCPDGPTKKLWQQVANYLSNYSNEDNVTLEHILNTHYKNGGAEDLASVINPPSPGKRLGLFAGIAAGIGLAVGIIIGIALVATGVFAPFGLGVLGAIALAATLGGGLALASGVTGLTAGLLTLPLMVFNPGEEEDELDFDTSLKTLGKLGGTSNKTPEVQKSERQTVTSAVSQEELVNLEEDLPPSPTHTALQCNTFQ